MRATLESSSKRGSFNRISNPQEFWSTEIGHLTYNMGIGHWRFWEEESSFRQLTFEILELKRRNWKSRGKLRKSLQTHSESYYRTNIKCHSESHSENHLESNLESYLESYLESHFENILKVMWKSLIWFVSWMRVKTVISLAFKSCWWWWVGGWWCKVIFVSNPTFFI